MIDFLRREIIRKETERVGNALIQTSRCEMCSYKLRHDQVPLPVCSLNDRSSESHRARGDTRHRNNWLLTTIKDN